jgi:hypothetical protein
MEEDTEQDRAKFVLKPKSFESVNVPLAEEPTKPIEVHTILQENLAVREAVTPLILNFEKKSSRRTRDYLILMAMGNGLILLVMNFLPRDPAFRTLGGTGLFLYSAGVTWVMWGVMDNY